MRALLPVLAGLAGGAVVGAGVAHLGLYLQAFTSASLVVLVIASLLAAWPNIVLHEAGHALAGLARGMRAIAFGVGPLRFERGRDGWHRRYGGGIRGIGGFAAMYPEGDRGLGRGDQILLLAGGPLANLLTAALCLAAVALLALPAWASGLLGGAAASALVLGVANLVPFHSRGWRSDGQGILDLLRDSPGAALQQQVNQLAALTMAGVRPRDWPLAIDPRPGADNASPMLAATADALRLSRSVDLGDAAAAARDAASLAGRYRDVPEAMQPAIAVSVAGHAAVVVRDPGLLAAWRPLCEGRSMLDLEAYRHWLDAELAALRGEPGPARAAIAQARQALPRVHDAVSRLLLGEFLDRLEAGPGAAAPAAMGETVAAGV